MTLNVTQLRDHMAHRFSDVEQVADSVVRATRKSGESPFAVYYIDIGEHLPSTPKALTHYQDRVIGRRYFEGRKSLQWSNYLYFVVSRGTIPHRSGSPGEKPDRGGSFLRPKIRSCRTRFRRSNTVAAAADNFVPLSLPLTFCLFGHQNLLKQASMAQSSAMPRCPITVTHRIFRPGCNAQESQPNTAHSQRHAAVPSIHRAHQIQKLPHPTRF